MTVVTKNAQSLTNDYYSSNGFVYSVMEGASKKMFCSQVIVVEEL